jgi:dihydrofolate reductase
VIGAVFIATSLDGYIARPDGSLDWLDEAGATAPEGEDFGFAAFFDSVDAIVIGRRTYDVVRSFGGKWPYGGKRVVVLSSGEPVIPSDIEETVSSWSGTPSDLAARFNRDGIARAYVDGGATIRSFLREGLIHEMTITTIPIILGSGIPLFGNLGRDIKLELLETRNWDRGLVQARYRVRS